MTLETTIIKKLPSNSKELGYDTYFSSRIAYFPFRVKEYARKYSIINKAYKNIYNLRNIQGIQNSSNILSCLYLNSRGTGLSKQISVL